MQNRLSFEHAQYCYKAMFEWKGMDKRLLRPNDAHHCEKNTSGT